jgi:CRP-like cAMP-binding protein
MDDIRLLVEAILADTAPDAFRPQIALPEWARMAGVLARRELAAGELLIRRGERERHAWLVERGRLQVFVTGGPPGSHRIATLGAGSLVGEPGLFTDVPRMAHVEAMADAVVWSLDAVRLGELAAAQPALAFELLRAAGAVMAARMRANLERGIPVS